MLDSQVGSVLLRLISVLDLTKDEAPALDRPLG